MKSTTDAMHRGLGRAAMDLRAKMEWSQADLANEIAKMAIKMRVPIRPTQVSVCRWETGETSPSPQHRMILARIASRDKRTGHLADLFRASASAWRVVGLSERRDVEDAETMTGRLPPRGIPE